jgi:hypothetical protein
MITFLGVPARPPLYGRVAVLSRCTAPRAPGIAVLEFLESAFRHLSFVARCVRSRRRTWSSRDRRRSGGCSARPLGRAAGGLQVGGIFQWLDDGGPVPQLQGMIAASDLAGGTSPPICAPDGADWPPVAGARERSICSLTKMRYPSVLGAPARWMTFAARHYMWARPQSCGQSARACTARSVVLPGPRCAGSTLPRGRSR